MKRTMVLAILLGIILSIGLGGCAPKAIPDEVAVTQETLPTAEPEVEPASIYSEAPQLAKRVAAGELPPVEERLPANPVVIQPVERGGVYGGTWNMGTTGSSSLSFIRVSVGYENLLRWNPAWTRIIPNIAQSYEISEDATEFTFYLREDLRWSDGAPFTADDIVFWYEAELLNEELIEVIPGYLVLDDTPVVVEKIDAYTVKFSFAGPYGQFPYHLADIKSDEMTARPMHYLKQFHPDYNPEGIGALVAEAGYENWIELYNWKSQPLFNPEVPTLNAWVLTDRYDENSTSIMMERNPYYWKVDTDFNQLPYIDRIEYTIYPSREDIELAARDGQFDMQYHELSIKESNYDDWAKNMATGDYDLHELINPRANYVAVELNLVHQDPVLRAVFSNKTFRIALSHAINRTELIDQVIGIPLEPRQPAPLKESPYYRERLETQYTEFDLPYANQLLDEAGYHQRDQEGYRLTPEGQRIEFTISTYVNDPVYFPAAEMVSEYWRELGLLVHIEGLEGWKPLIQLLRANEHDVIAFGVIGGLDVVQSPGIYMPLSEYQSFFAIPWTYWYENHNSGEEPPAPVKEQMQLYDQIKASTDQDEIESLMNQILAIAEEQFYVMGICRNENFYLLVKSNFHNVPRTMPKSFSYPTPAPTNPCQYFIDPQE